MKTDKIIIEKFVSKHTDEAAKSLSGFSTEELSTFIKDLSDETVFKLLAKVEKHKVAAILETLENKLAAEIIENLPSQTALLVLEQLSDDKRKEILSALPDKLAIQFTAMISYDEYAIGSLMDPKVFTLPSDLTVKDALEEVKRFEGTVPPQIFVVSRNQIFEGVISLHQLIRENSKTDIKSLISNNIPKLFPETSIKSVLANAAWQNYTSLPVTDPSDIFLGAIYLEAIRNFVEKKTSTEWKQVSAAGTALGELYRIGLSGLLRSAAEISTNPEK